MNIFRIKGLLPYLQSRILGQSHVLPRLCSVLERAELGLNPPGRPKGSFIFLGPTGVGKTETALAFTEYLYGPGKLFRFDMSEFQHPDSIKNFIGDESGQVGRLGRVLLSHSYGTLLFDEIEKAHSGIWDVFLQILDAGQITVGAGEACALSGFFVCFTSNLGSYELTRQMDLPFTTLERIVLSRLTQVFRPEFIGRLDEKLVFERLSNGIQRQIAGVMLARELERLAGLGYQLKPSPLVVEVLVRQGISKAFGARPLRQTVERLLGEAICHALKEGKPASGLLRVDTTRRFLLIEPLKGVSSHESRKIGVS